LEKNKKSQYDSEPFPKNEKTSKNPFHTLENDIRKKTTNPVLVICNNLNIINLASKVEMCKLDYEALPDVRINLDNFIKSI
jgi:hypothetical protein